jgi:cell division protein FtsW
MFIGRVNFKHILILGATGIIIFALFLGISLLFKQNYRLETWISSYRDFVTGEGGDNFQLKAIEDGQTNGGIIGKALEQRTTYLLPQPFSDFIYAIIVEEYGLVGGLLINFFYMWLLFRAGLMVRKLDRTFPAFLRLPYLANCISGNGKHGCCDKSVPGNRANTAFVSRGGSSILFSSFALGIILSISRGPKSEEMLEPIGVESPDENKTKQKKVKTNKNNRIIISGGGTEGIFSQLFPLPMH